jgi:hypothetical protein
VTVTRKRGSVVQVVECKKRKGEPPIETVIANFRKERRAKVYAKTLNAVCKGKTYIVKPV